jgi:minor extracellular serine protease Vpr
MKRWWVWCICGPALAATVPGRYIVELSTEPVAAHVAAMGKRGLLSAAAAQHRALIRAEHGRVRAVLAQRQATILESTDTVLNALVVQVPDAQAAGLAGVSGVKAVHPERIFHLVLDHALPLHKVPDAWNVVGFDNAGAGVKIGFIDTGIDVSHPGFQDPSLAVPPGYPLVNADSDLAYTNNKVIVARSYWSLWGSPDPDPSARDHVGHGTATAMAAAGATNTAPLATITGVAPKAWLGSYKVFGSPGVNDDATESAILKALDDAVADGMDVINISLGSPVAPLPGNDPEVAAVETASALGVMVVVAAGNNGPDPATISSPATAPSAISVGASDNDRVFSASVSISGGGFYLALPGSGPAPAAPITANIADVARLDGNGMACGALGPNSLQGAIALILRGVCTFEQKLDNAQQAGAVAALVYTDQVRPTAIPMAVGAATLPAEMVSYNDGIAIESGISASTTATLDFSLRPNSTSPDALASFSATGPNPDGAIKPDLVAVGTNIYTAAQSFDPKGDLYAPGGYGVFDGTSFSSPLVAGAAALIKAARPGLTAAQYRSLLIDNAAAISYTPGSAATAQQAGGGVLDVSAALRSTAAMAPVSLSFGIGAADAQITRSLAIMNVGTATETYLLSSVAAGGGPVAALPGDSVTLDPGASVSLPVTFSASGLGGSQYQGFIAVTGATSGVESRVPYWYAVPSGVPARITLLETAATVRAGASVTDAAVFHVSDTSGIVMLDARPTVTAISGGGSVVSVTPRNFASPGAFGLNVRLGPTPGANVFRITDGGAAVDVTLISQ